MRKYNMTNSPRVGYVTNVVLQKINKDIMAEDKWFGLRVAE